MRWLTGAQVALLGANDIEQDGNKVSLPAVTTNTISRTVLATFYPESESDEVVLMSGVQGTCIESIVYAGLGVQGYTHTAQEQPTGVLSVSNTLRVNWHLQSGKVVVSKIEVGSTAERAAGAFSKTPTNESLVWTTLIGTDLFDVATTASIARRAACRGGDVITTYRGVVVAEAVAMYLEDEPTAITAIDAAAKQMHRTTQNPEVSVLQLGSMCSLESASNLEECHAVDHVARLINDKTDGFYDELLPTAYVRSKSPPAVNMLENTDGGPEYPISVLTGWQSAYLSIYADGTAALLMTSSYSEGTSTSRWRTADARSASLNRR